MGAEASQAERTTTTKALRPRYGREGRPTPSEVSKTINAAEGMKAAARASSLF